MVCVLLFGLRRELACAKNLVGEGERGGEESSTDSALKTKIHHRVNQVGFLGLLGTTM